MLDSNGGTLINKYLTREMIALSVVNCEGKASKRHSHIFEGVSLRGGCSTTHLVKRSVIKE